MRPHMCRWRTALPTAATTPATSPPGSPGSPGYMPSTFSTSRKFSPTARTDSSTCSQQVSRGCNHATAPWFVAADNSSAPRGGLAGSWAGAQPRGWTASRAAAGSGAWGPRSAARWTAAAARCAAGGPQWRCLPRCWGCRHHRPAAGPISVHGGWARTRTICACIRKEAHPSGIAAWRVGAAVSAVPGVAGRLHSGTAQHAPGCCSAGRCSIASVKSTAAGHAACADQAAALFAC